MARVKRVTKRLQRRKKILKEAKGYWGTKSRHKQQAKVALTRAGQFAYRDRRNRKREFRRLWIQRISAAARLRGTSYSQLMHGLKQAQVEIDRKALSELAFHDPEAFGCVVEEATGALSS